jgi:TonB family protein
MNGTVEPRHRWAAVGSVVLHVLAVWVFSIQPPPVPEPEPVVEVMLEPPQPEKKRPRSRLAKKPANPPRTPREPHTLTARWQVEKQPPRNLPENVQLPEPPTNVPLEVVESSPVAVQKAAAPAVAKPATQAATQAAAATAAAAQPVAAPAAMPEGAQQPARVALVAGESGGDLSLPGSAAGRAVTSAGAEGQGLLTDRLQGARAAQETQGSAAWSQAARAAASPDDQRSTGLATAAAPTMARAAEEKAAGVASALASKSSATPAAGHETALPQVLRVAGGGARGASGREGGKAAGQAATAQTQAAARATPGEGGFVAESGQRIAPGSSNLLNASPQARPGVVLIGSGGVPSGPAYALAAMQQAVVGMMAPMRFERALAPARAGADPVAAPATTAPSASTAPARAQAAALPGDGEAFSMAPVEARMMQSHAPGSGGRLATQLAGAGKADSAKADLTGAGLASAASTGKVANPAAAVVAGGAESVGGAGRGRVGGQAIAAGTGNAAEVAVASQQARSKGEDACLPGLETDAPGMLCHIPQTQVQPVAMVEKVTGVEGQPSYARNNPSLLFSPIVPGGRVLLRVQILKDGTVGQVLVKETSGSRLLDDDTVNQIWRWRFNPAIKGGRAVDAWVDLPVTYRKSRIGD